MSRAVVIITARGGSKRVPRKNVLPLAGKPLINYGIEAASAAKLVDEVYVSTDDEEIASVATTAGARVIKRPGALATDTSSSMEALQHAYESIPDNETITEVVLLQPTAPLTTASDIDGALALARQKESTVVSAKPCKPFWSFTTTEDFTPLMGWEFFRTRSQDLPAAYEPNGALFIISPEKLDEGFYTPQTRAYIMPGERSIDIDTLTDFTIAEALLK